MGCEFGINYDVDFLVMNFNGLVLLLCDDESDFIFWELNVIVCYLVV